jgi:hypothetical protein
MIFKCEVCGLERKIPMSSEVEKSDFDRRFYGECVHCHRGRTFVPISEQLLGDSLTEQAPEGSQT